MARDTSMLRDVLFDELESLRDGSTDPKRAQAVAKLAQQIISTAKVEMDFHRLQMQAEATGKNLVLGSMDLGQRVAPAVKQKSMSIEQSSVATLSTSQD